MEKVYEVCPVLQNDLITLRQTIFDDAEELIKCYSDVNSAPIFNSDNCHGDTFFYESVQQLMNTMKLWDYSYKNQIFVRWTIILNTTAKILGTVEMFHRRANDEFNHYGILRIDLQSQYESKDILDSILKITNREFYKLFDVTSILTKAVPIAKERIHALKENGYKTFGKKLLIYDDYYLRDLE